MYKFRDWLPEGMKRIKGAALTGDSEAELNVGLFLGNLSIETGDVNIAKNWSAFYNLCYKKRSYQSNLFIFTSAGKNWRNYDY